MAESATATRTCGKCRKEFVPRGGRGRPRLYCPFCTPRRPEDVEAAREHWDRIEFERRRHAEISGDATTPGGRESPRLSSSGAREPLPGDGLIGRPGRRCSKAGRDSPSPREADRLHDQLGTSGFGELQGLSLPKHGYRFFVPTREECRAQNEVIFRAGNEAIVNNLQGAGPTLPLMCECGSADCLHRIDVTAAEYEAVRAHPARFVLERGHQDGDERVLDEFDRFTVVEKTGRGRDVAEL